MTVFFRLIDIEDKQAALESNINNYNNGEFVTENYEVDPTNFASVPGSPFSYWVSKSILTGFKNFPPLESEDFTAKQGLASGDDSRFVRLNWENASGNHFVAFSKGGEYSPFYSDVHLTVNWNKDGKEIKALLTEDGKLASRPQATGFYGRAGLTWPRRTTSGLSMRAMPKDGIFADKGPSIFVKDDSDIDLLALLAVVSSSAFKYLVELQLAAADAAARSYEVGVIQKTPIPRVNQTITNILANFAREAWSLKHKLDTVNEISHAFLLPEALRKRLGDFNPQAVADRMVAIQDEIDLHCFTLYDFSPEDQVAATQQVGHNQAIKLTTGDSEYDEAQAASIDRTDGILTWAVGVAFGRFDWRLASGERTKLNDPEPFDPLPAQSPGMLPSDCASFHSHQGILLDEAGHAHDLPTLIQRVLNIADEPLDSDVRRWLGKAFFPLHLKLYSKSRRQAPIFWPLQSTSGNYTLWVYYHHLNEQTLYTCVNDFVDPKLKNVTEELNALRNTSARSNQEEKDLERLADLEAEIKDFRDELLRLAKFWKPNLNDGVQITAAPLWKLFQHKAWQKKLKETWGSLEKGDYDWAHLACSIWPELVLRKCYQDRSLAIAHDVENDFWHEVEVLAKRGGKTKLEWQPKKLSDAELSTVIQTKIAEKKQ